MGFSGAEAFRGTSAPSLKAEVSGESNEFFVINFCYVLDDVSNFRFVYLTHDSYPNTPYHYLHSIL